MEHIPPPFTQFKSTTVLPMWEYAKFVAVRVDAEGSCVNQHILMSGPWHRYSGPKGEKIAVRCPHMLSHDERARVIEDIPPGSWEEKLAGQKLERLRLEAEKRRIEKAKEASLGRR